MVKFGLIPVTALVLCLVVVLTACSNASGSIDDDYAAKYRSAVKGLDHVERVDSSYSSTAGMGSTADLFLHADSSDPAVLEGVMQEAFPAVISAADGDPDANLALQVISKDGSTALSPLRYWLPGHRDIIQLPQIPGGVSAAHGTQLQAVPADPQRHHHVCCPWPWWPWSNWGE